MVLLFYTTYISVDLVHHEIFHVKVGKIGKKKFLFVCVLIFSFLAVPWAGL